MRPCEQPAPCEDWQWSSSRGSRDPLTKINFMKLTATFSRGANEWGELTASLQVSDPVEVRETTGGSSRLQENYQIQDFRTSGESIYSLIWDFFGILRQLQI